MRLPRPALLLEQTRREIEVFVQSLRRPSVSLGDGWPSVDLASAQWRLTIEFGKLVLEIWQPGQSLILRVDDIAYRDGSRLGVFVSKPGSRALTAIEFGEFEEPAGSGRAALATSRSELSHALLARLRSAYPGWRFERVSHRSDREHSFSAWYTRGLARRGTSAWAFLGLGEKEAPGAAEAALAYALIWLDWLRHETSGLVVGGLRLFLPRAAVDLSAHRAAYLNRRALQIEIIPWDASAPSDELVPVDLRDFGNLETRLAPRRRTEALMERHRPLLEDLLGEARERVDVVPEPSGTDLALRVQGLQIAQLRGQVAPCLYFGVEGSKDGIHRLDASNREKWATLLNKVITVRRPGGNPAHELYRLQSERWLESLLVRDITRVDPALHPEFVYPQVPAFAGNDRGVVDILAVRRDGRLAVIEVKVSEDLNLPLQGLDYWLRVRWLNERGQFPTFGYFPGLQLSPQPPVLYFVCPGLRYHSTYTNLIRYLDPSIEVVQVGLNDQWRERVQVLFRRHLRL
jgi:hypothetical protein